MKIRIPTIYKVAYGAIAVFSIVVCLVFLFTYGTVFNAEMSAYQENSILILYIAVVAVFAGFALYAGSLFFSYMILEEDGFTVRMGFSKKKYYFRNIESMDFVRTYNTFDGGILLVSIYFLDGTVKRVRWKFMLTLEKVQNLDTLGVQTFIIPNSKHYRA